MKVTIFGATGKIGKLGLEKALALGWVVTAMNAFGIKRTINLVGASIDLPWSSQAKHD
jgi:putative NADH-flavin reductase